MDERATAGPIASRSLDAVAAALRECQARIEQLAHSPARKETRVLTALREFADTLADQLRVLEAEAKDSADVRAAGPEADPRVAIAGAMARRGSPVISEGPRPAGDLAAYPSTSRLVEYRRLRWGHPLAYGEREPIPAPVGWSPPPTFAFVLAAVLVATVALMVVVFSLFGLGL